MLTLVEVVACLLARFGVVFCSKAGLSIQVQYTPISRSEVLCYDFVHRKETDRFWSHCKSSSRIVVNKNKLVCWPALKMIFSLFLCFPCAASFICAVCLKITDMPPCVQFQNWISKYYVLVLIQGKIGEKVTRTRIPIWPCHCTDLTWIKDVYTHFWNM